MLVILLVLLFLVTASLFLIVPALWGWAIYDHYRGSRAVTCPETHQQVAVSFDALHAAITGMSRAKPGLRLADCTRWPERIRCGQQCIPQALRVQPYTQGEISRPKEKKIYHLPVLIAAFAAWVLGAIWHSQFVFRAQWSRALGLGVPELHRIVNWWSPHLVSVAAVLLFAYGVAWLLAWSGWKGALRGAGISVAVWYAVIGASLVGLSMVRLPAELLMIELGYTFLASLVIGATIGGLSGRLVEATFEGKMSH